MGNADGGDIGTRRPTLAGLDSVEVITPHNNHIQVMADKTCKTCKWHDKESMKDSYLAEEIERDGGKCTNRFIREGYGKKSELIQSLMYSYEEGGWFWTGNNFGCIHHEAA